MKAILREVVTEKSSISGAAEVAEEHGGVAAGAFRNGGKAQ